LLANCSQSKIPPGTRRQADIGSIAQYSGVIGSFVKAEAEAHRRVIAGLAVIGGSTGIWHDGYRSFRNALSNWRRTPSSTVGLALVVRADLLVAVNGFLGAALLFGDPSGRAQLEWSVPLGLFIGLVCGAVGNLVYRSGRRQSA
jgi:hypothetical protein